MVMCRAMQRRACSCSPPQHGVSHTAATLPLLCRHPRSQFPVRRLRLQLQTLRLQAALGSHCCRCPRRTPLPLTEQQGRMRVLTRRGRWGLLLPRRSRPRRPRRRSCPPSRLLSPLSSLARPAQAAVPLHSSRPHKQAQSLALAAVVVAAASAMPSAAWSAAAAAAAAALALVAASEGWSAALQAHLRRGGSALARARA